MSCKITLAESAGFCFGVNRAVELVYRLLDEGKRVGTLGPIIHNPQLVQQLADRGVVIVDAPEQLPDGYTLVIRSHGVDRETVESIKALGIDYCDATCPFVSKIHRIVEENTNDKSLLLIAGDEQHAEVVGIKGYAKGSVDCYKNEQELENIILQNAKMEYSDIILVAQTTFNAEIWRKCEKILKKVYTNAKKFDTICDATSLRQSQAAKLAAESDLMVVVGGRHSSNTKKLFDICSGITKTIAVETADELPTEPLLGVASIGVTAGASTPAVIIKEVLYTMSDIIKNEGTPAEETAQINKEAATVAEKSFDDMTFEEALEASLNSMNYNQKVHGIVIAVNPSEVQVDIGRKYTGIVPADELSSDQSKRPDELVKVGDEIDLIVMKTNDQEGIITLSKRRYDSNLGFVKLQEALDSGEALDATVNAVVKGGVTAICNGVRVFIPASHATLSRSDSLEELVGTDVKMKIIDIRRGRSVVGSIRSVLKEKRREDMEKLWSTIAVGNTYEGTVKSLTSYGAFVDIGGVDGMIHVSELSWSRIKHPSDIVNVGDVVSVYVKELDMEKHKISLGYKKTEDNPWEIIKSKFQIGDVVAVKVVSFATYGAFANVMPGIDGLIHISQITDKRIEKPQDELKVGDVVNAKITDINYDTHRVSLSIRALMEPETVEEDEQVIEQDEIVASTEDMAALAEEPVEAVEEVVETTDTTEQTEAPVEE